MRRAVYRAANPISYITPRPVKQVRRATFYATHPWEMAERMTEDMIVGAVRPPRRTRGRSGGSYQVAYQPGVAVNPELLFDEPPDPRSFPFPIVGHKLKPVDGSYAGELAITEAVLDDIVDHARGAVPNIACGMLAGVEATIAQAYRATNIAAAPLLQWEIAPTEVEQFLSAMGGIGQSFAGVYHSNTRTSARPSYIDEANWATDVPYVIVGFAAEEYSEIRAFRRIDGATRELEIEPRLDPEGQGAHEPFADLDLFLEVRAGGDRVMLPVSDLLKRFQGTYQTTEELDELLREEGFRLSASLASASPSSEIEIGVDDPPATFQARWELDSGQNEVCVPIDNLLEAIDRERLTDAARDDILDALDDAGLTCDEDKLWTARRDDRLRLWRSNQ